MQSIGRRRALLSSTSNAFRYNSTDASQKHNIIIRRAPLQRLGNVLIPSAEEIRAKTAKKKYETDISYLKNAPASGLAGRLARRNLETSEATVESTSQQAKMQNLDTMLPASPKRTSLTPEEIQALAQKRKEQRLAREGKKANEVIKSIRPISDKLLQTMTSTFNNPARTSISSEPLKSASESAARRKAERLRRQSEPQSQSRVRAKGKQQSGKTRKSKDEVAEVVMDETATEAAEVATYDALNVGQAGHEPEFKGPGVISGTLLDVFGRSFGSKDAKLVAVSGTASIPTSQVEFFKQGSYSSFVTSSASEFATPPDALGPIKLAQLTLSHQRHISIPKRHGVMDIVTRSVQPASNPTVARVPQ